MTEPLDVLLIEHHPGLGAVDARALEAAGHRVTRCHPATTGHETPRREDRYLCAALTGGTCPVEGRVDVALLVRPRVSPRPSIYEQATSCAVRAGVPVVEHGPEVLDPFAHVVAGRVDGDLVEACERAAESRFDEVRDLIHQRLEPLLGPDLPAASISIDFRRHDDRFEIAVSGPALGDHRERFVCLRVLEAARDDDLGPVDVRYTVLR